MKSDTKIICVLVLTFAYFIVEFVVGTITKSLSLTADSFNMLSDSISMFIGIWAMRLGNKETCKPEYSYGYRRAEVLGTLINCVFQMGLCFSLLVEAIKGFVKPSKIKNPLLVLWVGTGGLLINLLGIYVIILEKRRNKKIIAEEEIFLNDLGSSVVKSNADGKHLSGKDAQEKDQCPSDLNMGGVFLRILGDALGSVAVLISACIAMWTDFKWVVYIDPLLSFFIVLILIKTTWPFLTATTRILIQATPLHVDLPPLAEELKSIEHVLDIHDLHVWQLCEVKNIATVHICISENAPLKQISKQVHQIMHMNNVHSTTIQFEIPDNMNSNSGQCFSSCEGRTCEPQRCCPLKSKVTI